MAKELKDYVTFDDNGKPIFDNEAFTADLDRERNQASETARSNAEKKLRANLEKEIRDKLAQEAEMTANEKFEARLKEFEEKERLFNKREVEQVFKASNLFAEEEINLLVLNLGSDQAKNLESANAFVEARKKYTEKYEKDFLAKVQSQQPRPDGNGNGGKTETEAEKYAKKHSEKQETKIINF